MRKKFDNQLALPIDDMPEIHIETHTPTKKSKNKTKDIEQIDQEAPSDDGTDTSAAMSEVPAEEIVAEYSLNEQSVPASDDADGIENTPIPVTDEPEESEDQQNEKDELTLYGTPMSAIKPKPKILLETPYKVSSKKGEHMRYHLEYDYADKSISPDHVTLMLNNEGGGSDYDHVHKPLYIKNTQKSRRKKILKEVFDWSIAILIAIALTLFIRTFVFVIVTVDGPSMQPGLQTDERLFVTRFDYYFREPQRGEIIICKFPSPIYNERYVKRVIGLPGESIEIKNGITYINGEPLTEVYIKDKPIEDYPLYKVPENCYFVMGDNRNDSSDSRKSGVGVIPKSLLIGRARYIVYPFSNLRQLEDNK